MSGKKTIISVFELNITFITASVPSINAIWPKHVSGFLTEQTTFAHLSSLGKKGHPGDRTEPLIIYQGSERELDQIVRWIRRSRIIRLREREGVVASIIRAIKGRSRTSQFKVGWLNPAQTVFVSPSEFCSKQ